MKAKDYMCWQGLGVTGMAKRCKTSIGYMSRILSGELEPSRDAIKKIHRGTGGHVTFTDLVDVGG